MRRFGGGAQTLLAQPAALWLTVPRESRQDHHSCRISSDVYFAELTGTKTWISYEVQHVDILPHFVLTHTLNQHHFRGIVILCVVLFFNFFPKPEVFVFFVPVNTAAVMLGFTWCCHLEDTMFVLLWY